MTRTLIWDGLENVRDLGGIPTEDGSSTRYGTFVRADNVRRLQHCRRAGHQTGGADSGRSRAGEPGGADAIIVGSTATITEPRPTGERAQSGAPHAQRSAR